MLDDRSFALLTPSREPRRAIVFVHGFSGHPAKTWRAFDRPVAGDDWWDESDLFFFGYTSTREEIRLTSYHLREFLKGLLPCRPTAIAALVSAEAPNTCYEELVLVGHSQGGLVARDAVLQFLWEQTTPGIPSGSWETNDALELVATARMKLFAPAIFGARLSGLKGMALQSLGLGTVAKMIIAGSSSYQELQTGSSVIEDVKQQTTSRAQAHPDVRAFRADIAWAASDRVVVPGGQYNFDPSSHRLGGTNHSSVCKPHGPADPQVALVRSLDVD
jgi:pimeloyl-ACP methyl ester carboxylesterase